MRYYITSLTVFYLALIPVFTGSYSQVMIELKGTDEQTWEINLGVASQQNCTLSDTSRGCSVFIIQST